MDRVTGVDLQLVEHLEQMLDTTVKHQDSAQAGDKAFDHSQVMKGGLIKEDKHNNQDGP